MEYYVILQIDIAIYVEKKNSSMFFHSCCTIRSQKSWKKSPLNMLLSDTHGFIYSVLHCIYTSLYTTGPFIEGSYCKSSLLRAMIGSGPLFLFCFLKYFSWCTPKQLGIEMADTSYRNSRSERFNANAHSSDSPQGGIKQRANKQRRRRRRRRARDIIFSTDCSKLWVRNKQTVCLFGKETQREIERDTYVVSDQPRQADGYKSSFYTQIQHHQSLHYIRKQNVQGNIS